MRHQALTHVSEPAHLQGLRREQGREIPRGKGAQPQGQRRKYARTQTGIRRQTITLTPYFTEDERSIANRLEREEKVHISLNAYRELGYQPLTAQERARREGPRGRDGQEGPHVTRMSPLVRGQRFSVLMRLLRRLDPTVTSPARVRRSTRSCKTRRRRS